MVGYKWYAFNLLCKVLNLLGFEDYLTIVKQMSSACKTFIECYFLKIVNMPLFGNMYTKKLACLCSNFFLERRTVCIL